MLTADLFVSLDGWAKGEHSSAFFGYPGPELEGWIADELARPQRVLLGRRTYEALTGVASDPDDPMTRLPTTVFSRTVTVADWPNATVESRDVVEAVRDLKATAGLPLRTMGSLSVVRQLLDAGLVDRLRLMVFPLVLGPSGRESAFDGVGELALALVSERVLDGRIVLLEYAPSGGADVS